MSSLENSLDALVNRRRFLKSVGVGALGLAGAGLLTKGADAAPIPGGLDAAILNFALNLEYLEAEFYVHAVTGAGLAALGVPGTSESNIIIKAGSKVPFASTNIQQYATEIAESETAHVRFIQKALTAVGVPYVVEPKIDLLNSFKALGSLIGVPNFDPFADDVSFLLGAYIFEDVGVTAYHGAAPLLSNKTVLNYAAGILAVEAYHASLVRTNLFELKQGPATQAISNVRNMLSGPVKDSNGAFVDSDYGVDQNGTSSIVLSDSNAIAFARTTRQVLNIVYGAVNATQGLFFPQGVNGFINK